jgi:hypothetical protein
MKVTRRQLAAAGASLALPAAAWSQTPAPSLKLQRSATGHLVTPTDIRGEPVYAMLDNLQPSAIGFNAPGLSLANRRALDAIRGDPMLVRMSQPVPFQLGGVDLMINMAMRGLDAFSRWNGLPIHVLFGVSLFEEAVVELNFRSSQLTCHNPNRFRDPLDATPFESKARVPGNFYLPVDFGDGAKGNALVALGYPEFLRINHPKVGEWINDGRQVTLDQNASVFGDVVTKQEQVNFIAPPVKIGPWDLGAVKAEANVGDDDAVIATLGVKALLAFHIWFDGRRGRMWLRPNLAKTG